jgi:hypothetical protein
MITLGADEALTLQPLHRREESAIAGSKRTLQRPERCRLAGSRLAEQMLEGVLGLLAAAADVSATPAGNRAVMRPKNEGRGHEPNQKRKQG